MLELVEALTNVSEACHRRSVSHNQFYDYRRRFQTHGLEGLKDLQPIHHSHPMTTAPRVEQRIVESRLDQSIEYLNDDELLEVTPVSLRTRKRIPYTHQRGREDKRAKEALGA